MPTTCLNCDSGNGLGFRDIEKLLRESVWEAIRRPWE
jgi:hypothetical protein